jgi:predicted  nucleic acid-binding Zn-ribbon protein
MTPAKGKFSLSRSGKHKCRSCNGRWSDYDRRDGRPCVHCGSRKTIVIDYMSREEHARRTRQRQEEQRIARTTLSGDVDRFVSASDMTYEELGLTDADFGWYENE